MVYLSDSVDEFGNGIFGRRRGLVGLLIFKDGKDRCSYEMPSYHDLELACDFYDIEYASIRQTIHNAPDHIHTFLIDVPVWKSNNPKVGDKAQCKNCDETIVYASRAGRELWVHQRGYVKHLMDNACFPHSVAEPAEVGS